MQNHPELKPGETYKDRSGYVYRCDGKIADGVYVLVEIPPRNIIYAHEVYLNDDGTIGWRFSK